MSIGLAASYSRLTPREGGSLLSDIDFNGRVADSVPVMKRRAHRNIWGGAGVGRRRGKREGRETKSLHLHHKMTSGHTFFPMLH